MRTFFRFFILMALLGLGSLGLNADATLQGFSRSSRLCGVNSLYLGLKAINQPMDYTLLRENFPSANDSGVSLSQLADFLAQKNIPHKLSLYKSRTITDSSLDTAFFVLLKEGTDYHIALARPTKNHKIQLLDRDAPASIREFEPDFWNKKIFALGISSTPFPLENSWDWFMPMLGVPLLLVLAFIAWLLTNKKKQFR